MKEFMYFESTEGGMESFKFGENSPLPLYGWMSEGCVVDDTALLEWTKTAKVGDVFDHRLGTAVCIVGSGLAHVICCNDAVMVASLGDEAQAEAAMEPVIVADYQSAKGHYRDSVEYLERCYWHIYTVRLV